MFSGCIVLPASKKIEAGSSGQGASPSAVKNTREVLVVWTFRGPYVSFVTTDELSVRVTKITSKIGVS